MKEPSGASLETRHVYDARGRLTSTDGPLPGTADTVYYRYDAFGRRTWEIGAAAAGGARIATRTHYRDSDDKPLYTETGTIPDAAGTSLAVFRRTDYAYDARRNPVREAVSAPAAGWGVGADTTFRVVDRSFDDRGRAVCQAQRMNPASFPLHGAGGSLPADACVAGAEGGHGPDRIARTVYDLAGQRRRSAGSAALQLYSMRSRKQFRCARSRCRWSVRAAACARHWPRGEFAAAAAIAAAAS